VVPLAVQQERRFLSIPIALSFSTIEVYKFLTESQVQSSEPFTRREHKHFGCVLCDFLYKTIELWHGNSVMSCIKFFERDIHKFFPTPSDIEEQ
jgi:hypothetical protein